MDFELSTGWWVVVGLLVIVELASGTFYLLMLALGSAAGAVAAHLGLGLSTQIVVAAICGGGTTVLWHLHRMKHPRSAPANQNPDVHLDIGREVWVAAWAADGCTRVSYRGTEWSARLAPGFEPHSGKHRIYATEGNSLILKPAEMVA